MQAGELRHRIDIVTPVSGAQDGYGNARETWTTLHATVPAAIVPTASREVYAGNKIDTIASHIVTIRYIAGITVKMRVKWGSRTFAIVGMVNPEERNVSLDLICQEQF